MRIILLFLLSLQLFAIQIDYQGKKANVVSDDVLIKLKDNNSKMDDQQRIEHIFQEILGIKDSGELLSTMVINTGRYAIYQSSYSGLDIAAFIKRTKNHPEIEAIQPNFIYKTMELSRDYYINPQTSRWNYEALNIPMAHSLMDQEKAWNPDITIAVLDTGIYPHHPAFNRIVDPYNIYFVVFYYGSEVYMTDQEYDAPIMGMQWNPTISDYTTYTVTGGYHDWQGHGTHCAGLIGANYISKKNFYGVAPNYRIMPVKVIDDNGEGNSAVILQGVMYALKMGADVFSMSLGGTSPDPFAEQIYKQEIYGRGIPIIAAAGNSYEEGNLSTYPASYDSTIAVTSLGSDNLVAYYSQSHDWVDIAAPGGDGKRKNKSGKQRQIFSTWTADPRASYKPLITPIEPGEDRKYYAGISGTSMATPQIAGLVALMRGINYSLTPDQIKTIIQDTGAIVQGSYHPQQLQKMKGLRKADAYQAIKILFEDNLQVEESGNWKNINLEISPDFPKNTLFINGAKISINYDDYDLALPSTGRVDVTKLPSQIFTLPMPAPPGGQKTILKISFSGMGYIPEKSIYLHNLSSMGYIIYRNYSYPKFTVILKADQEKQNFILSITID